MVSKNLFQTSVNTGAIVSCLCTHFLHIYDIILVGDDIVM